MKIKAKITLGVGLLFALIVLLSGVGIRQVYVLANGSKNILTANYHSLEYGQGMLRSLPDDAVSFETWLQKQEQNITEVGEGALTQRLRQYFEQLKMHPRDSAAITGIQASIDGIMTVNMEAIQRKNVAVAQHAENANFWIGLIGATCFIIAFTLLFNLPANIADPISALTESIRQIAAGNYTQRIAFKSRSEFGELAGSFNAMAEKLEEYNNSNLAKLMTEKTRIETLINNMHDPVIGLDEHKTILFMNEEALKITGLTHADAIGKPAAEIAITNDLMRSLLQYVVAENIAEMPQKPLKIYADGRESYFERERLAIIVTPTGEKTPRPLGHVLLLRNVTAYKELDAAKTNFIATVSHEFKTPIAAIKMSLQLLENGQIGPLNEEQRQLLDSIQDDAGRLLNITGELLDLTQVETGNIQLSVRPADAVDMLRRATKATKTLADQKKIRLVLDCPADLPAVMADPEKMTWVLINLISNAIRYSYENAAINLRLYATDDKVWFVVQDTGQGIAPQNLPKVFDRYFRTPGSPTEGTGLGLAISKEFVEAQGGNITVTSDFGSGSTFTVGLIAAG